MDEAPAPARDIDARFLLANERTLLAWIRTSLTLLAVGAGLLEFGSEFAGRHVLAAVIIVAGNASAAGGARRYASADRAMRNQALPDVGVAPYLLAGAVSAVGLALLVALAID